MINPNPNSLFSSLRKKTVPALCLLCWIAAIQAMQSLLTVNPNDRAALLLLNRIEEFLQAGVPEDWTGVEKMNMK